MSSHGSSRHHKLSRGRSKDLSKNWRAKFQRMFHLNLSRHTQAALLSLHQIISKPLSSAMICIVIAIALALPAGLYIMLQNIKTFTAGWESSAPIMLYLTKSTSEERARILANEINSRSEIEKVEYISPEQGLIDFEKQSGLGDILKTLKENPLPGLLVVTPVSGWRTSDSVEILLQSFKSLPEIDVAQFDLNWAKRLDTILNLSNRIIYALGILLGVGVVFIIGNTIYLATQSQKDEIFVFQLVGASRSFIRRPFLYTGMWYGLLGGLFACILISIFFFWIDEPSKLLGQLYVDALVIDGLNLGNIASLLGAGVFLGVAGAWSVLHKHLS